MKAFGVLLCLVTIAGCADSPAAPTGPVNAQVVLAPGETANVAEAGIGIRFNGVSGDSRCPADALCIQGGDAIVHIQVLSTGAPVDFELHTGSLQPVRLGTVTIALENLSPYPFSSRTISPSEYRATLRITR
jgi:hypothetical protein